MYSCPIFFYIEVKKLLLLALEVVRVTKPKKHLFKDAGFKFNKSVIDDLKFTFRWTRANVSSGDLTLKQNPSNDN